MDCDMMALCTSCDYFGSETLVGVGRTLESCRASCLHDSTCWAIDFGKNGRAGECYHNHLGNASYFIGADFDVWKKNCSSVAVSHANSTRETSLINSSLGWLPSWRRVTAKDKARVVAAVPKLKSGGRVFLLSSLSHDDLDQWPLIPHFFRHYCDHLGVHPAQFLLILHSDSKDISGITIMATWLKEKYGAIHTYPVVEPYTSRRHFQIKMNILNERVVDEDWVMQVDADEFVFFPNWAHSIYDLFNTLDDLGRNVYYGLMIDRLAGDGSVEHVPIFPKPLHKQYPLNCAVTLLIQGSDVRKASAYRGNLRTTTGNHNVLGLNESVATLRGNPGEMAILLHRLRKDVATGPVYDLLPGVRNNTLPLVSPIAPLATVYHYKWIGGLAEKLRRRWVTETYTHGEYGRLYNLISGGSFSAGDIKTLCNVVDLPDRQVPIRALTARELTLLFLNIKPAFLDQMVREAVAQGHDEEVWQIIQLANNLRYSIAREDHIPLD